MKKKKRNNGKINPQSIFKDAKISTKISIAKYELDSISTFLSLKSYKHILTLSTIAMVCTIMLCQIKCMKPDASSRSLDQLPSFKLYRKRIITNNPGHALAITIATALPEVLVHLPSQGADEIEEWMYAVLDCYIGNEKVLSKASSNNITDYVSGHMSRILGYLQSCPSSNIGIFNINSSIVNWNLEDTINNLPKPLSEVPKEDVINLFKEIILVDGEIDSFMEKSLEGSFSIDGSSKIEYDLWESKVPKRLNPSANSVIVNKDIDQETAKLYLTDIEYRTYKAAILINKKEIINKLNRVIKEKQDSEKTTRKITRTSSSNEEEPQ